MALQHWLGLFCFAAGFRRPAYSILQAVFDAVMGAEGEFRLSDAMREEILSALMLLPLLHTDLGAELRSTISCSDASPSGGGAAEATHFAPQLGRLGQFIASATAKLNEELGIVVDGTSCCCICGMGVVT
eukprot:6455946-Amphidinium_carterae.1